MPLTLRFFSKNSTVVFLSIIIAFYLVNGIFYLNAQSLTSDEASFYNYAVRYLQGRPERTFPRSDNSKMPISALNTIPRITQEYILKAKPVNDGGIRDIMHGRYVTLFISLLTIVFVFMWAKEMYNKKAGLFSALLYSFCPNSLANAGLVTTDAYSSLFLLVTFYFLWKFCNTGQQKFFLLFTVSIAMAQLVKQSLFHLYVLTPLCLIIYNVRQQKKWNANSFVKKLLVFSFINLLIINTGYYFYDSFLPLGKYHFMSDLFINLQKGLPSSFPIPFPKPFVEGLDLAKYYDQIGGGTPQSSFSNVTILGNVKTGEGIWYYYFVTLFFKVPIAYFVFLAWGTWLLIKRQSGNKFIQNEFFLIAPVVYFLVTLSFFYNTQCGIRHIIFIFPLLAVFMGIIMSMANKAREKFWIVGLTLFLLMSVLSYWRNYYPYTNEFILDKKNAYQYVGSQNLDFLQGGLFLRRYLSDHKNVHLAKEIPEKGFLIISIHDYMDTWNKHNYEWLKCYKPVDHVAHNYLIIDTRKPCPMH